MGICITCKNAPLEMDMGYTTFYVLRNRIEDFVGKNYSKATESFLTQSDCEGKLSYRECKDLLDDIKGFSSDEKLYGYVWNRRSMNDFKTLLAYCYSHRCNLTWF